MTIKIGYFIICSALLLTVASKASGQWVQTNGPFLGATISCFKAHDSVIFAGTDGTGVFRSTDGGIRWESTPLLDIINAIEVYGQDVFAATAYDALYRSTDNGISWTRLDSGIYSLVYNCLASSGKNLFASGDGELFRSSDTGASWIPIGSEIIDQVEALLAAGNDVFAGTEDGFFRSTDEGVSFSQFNIGAAKRNIYSLALSGANLFAGTDSGIFISLDSGVTWQQAGLDNLSIEAIAVGGSILFAVTDTNGAFMSLDSGNTWAAIDFGLSDRKLRTIAVVGSSVFAGTSDGGGSFRSTDGGARWGTDDSGLTSYMVQSLAVSGNNLFATTYAGDIRSSDYGASWIFDPVLSSYDAPLAVNGGNIVGICPQGVIASSNAGSSWTVLHTVGPSNNTGLIFPDPIAVNGSYFFVGTGGGVSYSMDSGGSWNQISSYLPVGGIYCLLSSDSTVFAGGETGVYRMTNTAADWTSEDELSNNDGIFSLAGTGSNLFIGTNLGGVYHSKNEGRSAIPMGPANRTVFSLLMKGAELFAGTDSGVYLSDNNGANWISISSGLNDTNVLALAVQDSFLFAGTWALGVWRRPLSEIVWPYTISAAYDSLDFGNINVSRDSSLTVRLKNTGNVDLAITSLGFSSKNNVYTYDSVSLPLTIQPGDSLSVTITFTPSALGIQRNTFVVLSEATELDIPISGDGIESASVVETMSLSPSLRVFPNPASGNLQIMGSQSGEVHLFDLMGRERMNTVMDGTGATMDVSHLEDGMYFLRSGNESAKVEVTH